MTEATKTNTRLQETQNKTTAHEDGPKLPQDSLRCAQEASRWPRRAAQRRDEMCLDVPARPPLVVDVLLRFACPNRSLVVPQVPACTRKVLLVTRFPFLC